MIFFIKQSDFYSSISNRFIPVVYTYHSCSFCSKITETLNNTLWEKNTYWFFIIRNNIVSIRIAKSSRFLFVSLAKISLRNPLFENFASIAFFKNNRSMDNTSWNKSTFEAHDDFDSYSSISHRDLYSSLKNKHGWKTHRLIFHRPQLKLHDDFVVEIKRFRSFEGNLSESKLNETIHCGRRDTPFERNIRRAIILVTNNDFDKIRRRQNRLLIVHKRFPIFQKISRYLVYRNLREKFICTLLYRLFKIEDFSL